VSDRPKRSRYGSRTASSGSGFSFGSTSPKRSWIVAIGEVYPDPFGPSGTGCYSASGVPLSRIRCELDAADLVAPDACVACAEAAVAPRGARCRFTGSLLRAMYAGAAGEGRADAGISVTGITGCPRRTALEALLPYDQAPNRMWPATRGTLFHRIPEAHQTPGTLTEVRFRRAYAPGRWLTGQVDEADPAAGIVKDYKTGRYAPRPDDLTLTGRRSSWVWQLNLYRWLLADGERMDTGAPVRADITTLGIVHLAMDAVTKLAVPLLPLADVGAFAAERAGAVADALESGGDVLPPPAYDATRHPLCVDWCPVREACLARPL
jgi:PD-(D/E)XK nuclease superfamily